MVPGGSGSRIGKKIYAKGMLISLMIENQQYRPQATYWLYLIRNCKNPNTDLDAKSKIFEDLSSALPMDYADTSKVEISCFAKKIVVKMPNSGTTQPMGTTVNGAASEIITNQQKIQKFWVPLNCQITFCDDADNERDLPVANQRYQWVIGCYNNFSTTMNGSVYPVGHVTMTMKVKFTDV